MCITCAPNWRTAYWRVAPLGAVCSRAANRNMDCDCGRCATLMAALMTAATCGAKRARQQLTARRALFALAARRREARPLRRCDYRLQREGGGRKESTHCERLRLGTAPILLLHVVLLHLGLGPRLGCLD